MKNFNYGRMSFRLVAISILLFAFLLFARFADIYMGGSLPKLIFSLAFILIGFSILFGVISFFQKQYSNRNGVIGIILSVSVLIFPMIVKPLSTNVISPIKFLIATKTPIKIPLSITDIPLLQKTLSNDIQAVKNLIGNGTNINMKTSKGETALLLASSKGYTELVILLLKNGASINAIASHKSFYGGNMIGYTSLSESIKHGHTNVVKLLIDHGALDASYAYQEENPFNIAMNRQDYETIKYILDRKTNILKQLPSYNLQAYVNNFVKKDNVKLINLLIKYKPNLLRKNSTKSSIIELAKSNEMKKILLDHGAS